MGFSIQVYKMSSINNSLAAVIKDIDLELWYQRLFTPVLSGI